MQISVKHVLFSRVEADYSPKRRGGYQVVYQSSGLEAEIGEIEKRLRCFQYDGNENAERYQFFSIPSGQIALARTVPIINIDTTIIDRDGRPGAFIAHCYVVTKEDFKRVRNDPFVFFHDSTLFPYANEDTFIQTVPHFAEQPPADLIEVNPHFNELQSEKPEGWADDELSKIFQMTLNAMELVNQKQSLFFQGEHDEIYNMLSMLLFFLEPRERLMCSFDTAVDSCIPAPGQFWAVGGLKRPPNTNFIPVRFDTHKIDSRTVPDPKASHYVAWLRSSWQKSGRFSDVVNEVYTAQIAAETLAAGETLPTDLTLQAAVLRSFMDANRPLIDELLLKALIVPLEAQLAGQFAPALDHYVSPAECLNWAATQNVELPALAEAVYQWLLQEKPVVKAWKKIAAVAENADHALLGLLATIQTSGGIIGGFNALVGRENKARTQVLKELQSHNLLEQALHDLYQKWLTPADFVIEPTVHEVVAYTAQYFQAGEPMEEEVFKDLVETILEVNGGDELSPLSAYVQQMQQKKMVSALAKAIKKQKSDADFSQAVEQRLEAL